MNFGAPAAQVIGLGGGRIARQIDGYPDPRRMARVGYAQAMIAARGGDQAARLSGVVQGGQLAHGAPRLKRARDLQAFQL